MIKWRNDVEYYKNENLKKRAYKDENPITVVIKIKHNIL